MNKDELKADAQRIVGESKDADFERWKKAGGKHDLDYMPYLLIQRSIPPDAPHAVRAGMLISHLTVAMRMLALESGRAFASFVALDAIVPRKWRSAIIFMSAYLMVGGVLFTLETWPPLIDKASRFLFGT